MHNCAYSRPLGPARRWRSGKLGRVLRHLLDLLLPVDCGGCGAPGAALCPDCAALLGVPSQVYPACCPTGPPVYALGNYHGRLHAAILAYKERGRRDLANPLGAALLQIRSLDADCAYRGLESRSLHPDCGSGTVWMVPVPSRNAAAGRRGGQHVALLARRQRRHWREREWPRRLPRRCGWALGCMIPSACRRRHGERSWPVGYWRGGPACRPPAPPSSSSTTW